MLNVLVTTWIGKYLVEESVQTPKRLRSIVRVRSFGVLCWLVARDHILSSSHFVTYGRRGESELFSESRCNFATCACDLGRRNEK